MFRNAKSIVAGLSLATLVLAAPGFAADVPASQPAAGQKLGRGGATAAERYEKTIDQLDLTDDQKKQVEPIVTQLKSDLKDLRADDKLSADEKKTKAKDLLVDVQKKIDAILTPEQQAKLKQIRADEKAKRDKNTK